MSEYGNRFEGGPGRAPPRRGDIIGAFTDAVRDNPVSAALIGMGALWLFTGGNRVSLLGGHDRTSILGTVAHGAGSVAHGATRAAGRMGGAVASTVTSTASSVGSGFSEAAHRVGEYVGGSLHGVDAQSAYRNTGDMRHDWDEGHERTGQPRGQSSMASLRDGMQDMFERHPMVLGLAGLALGAGVAATLPLTETELETGEAARSKISEATERAKELAGAVAEEVRHPSGGDFGGPSSQNRL